MHGVGDYFSVLSIVCIYIRVSVCVCVQCVLCMHVCIRVCCVVCECVCTCMGVCVCVCVCVRVQCMQLHIRTCMYVLYA